MAMSFSTFLPRISKRELKAPEAKFPDLDSMLRISKRELKVYGSAPSRINDHGQRISKRELKVLMFSASFSSAHSRISKRELKARIFRWPLSSLSIVANLKERIERITGNKSHSLDNNVHPRISKRELKVKA